MAETKPNLNPTPISNLHGSGNSRFCSHFSFPRSPCSFPAPRSPLIITSGKADSSFIYHHTPFSICQYLNRHFFNREITVNPLLSYPGCQRVFFLLFAAKIEQGSRDCDERFFFPLFTIAVNFRRKQQEKKNLWQPGHPGYY